MNLRPLIAACLCVAGGLSPNLASAIDYTFTTIADTSGEFASFGASTINNSGMVAFDASYAAGGYTIVTGDGITSNALYDFNPYGQFNLRGPSINNGGTVAFLDTSLTPNFTQFVSRGNGGPTTTIADTLGKFGYFEDTPRVNDSGTVAFDASYDTGGGGVFTGDGSAITTIVDTSGSFSNAGNQDINNSGTVAFWGEADDGAGGFVVGMFTGNGGPVTTIADTSTMFSTMGYYPTINDSGVVAFDATLDSGVQGIFIGDGGPVTTVADSMGLFDNLSSVSINNNGMVVFDARLDDGTVGIFTGGDPLDDRVLVGGDVLSGLEVAGVDIFPQGSLNDSGQIALHVFFTNGLEAIVRADPVPIPPAAWLFAPGLLGLISIARRKAA